VVTHWTIGANAPRLSGRGEKPLVEIVVNAPGLAFRLHELGAGDAELREDRGREDQDAQPAEPLDELAPQQYRPRVDREVDRRGRAGRRDAAHALEQRVDRVGERSLTRRDEGDRADERDREPRERDHEERLPGSEIPLVGEPLEEHADGHGDPDRQEERNDVLGVVQCERER